MTPGFTLVTEHVTLLTPFNQDSPGDDPVLPRNLGLVRLDHDGGSRLYVLIPRHNGVGQGWTISLQPYSPGDRLRFPQDAEAPTILFGDDLFGNEREVADLLERTEQK